MSFADPAKGRHVMQSPARRRYGVPSPRHVKEGDILGYSSGWKRALATVSSVISPQLVALKDTVSGGVMPGRYRCSRYRLYRCHTRRSGLSGRRHELRPGHGYRPSTTNDVKTVIGVLLDATTVLLNLSNVQVLA